MARIAIRWSAGASSVRDEFDLPEILTHADTARVLAALRDVPDGTRVSVEVDADPDGPTPRRITVEAERLAGT